MEEDPFGDVAIRCLRARQSRVKLSVFHIFIVIRFKVGVAGIGASGFETLTSVQIILF